MNEIYDKVVRIHDVRIPASRRSPEGVYSTVWYRASVEVTINTAALAKDMTACVTNKSRRSVKARGAIVARALNIAEVPAP